MYISRKDVLDPYWFPEGLPGLRLSMSNEAERLFLESKIKKDKQRQNTECIDDRAFLYKFSEPRE